MGKSRFEKIYAVCVVLTLCFFLGSAFIYYFQHHDIVNNGLINDTPSSKINWAELYPFDEDINDEGNKNVTCAYTVMGGGIIEKYLSLVEPMKSRIDKYISRRIFARSQMIFAAKDFERCLLWPQKVVDRDDENGIVKMTNDYLTGIIEKIPDIDIVEIANSVVDFAKFLSGEGIDFIYVNGGYKVNPQDTQLNDYWVQREFSNHNADKLLQILHERSIDTIDFRAEILNAGIDWYGAYYIGDHHWTNVTQLWQAGVVANKLNRDYKFNFDLSYFDKNNYDITRYEKIFLGSQGRAKADLSYLEDYELILPKFNTSFEITIPIKNFHRIGEYRNTLANPDMVEQIRHYVGGNFLLKLDIYTGATRIQRPDQNTIVLNKLRTNNEGKKILMVQDSFGMYLAGYLAMDVSEIDIIDPLTFTGSIRTYVRKMCPDIVILLFSAERIQPIDWSTHASPFDLR